jgi:hypothetical protein
MPSAAVLISIPATDFGLEKQQLSRTHERCLLLGCMLVPVSGPSKMVSGALASLSKPDCRKVHSTASEFPAATTKKQAFDQILEQAELLFDGQRNWVRRRYQFHVVSNCEYRCGM